MCLAPLCTTPLTGPGLRALIWAWHRCVLAHADACKNLEKRMEAALAKKAALASSETASAQARAQEVETRAQVVDTGSHEACTRSGSRSLCPALRCPLSDAFSQMPSLRGVHAVWALQVVEASFNKRSEASGALLQTFRNELQVSAF